MTDSLAKANTLVVLDFETTGLSPEQGDRAIEIGAVRIENGEVVDRFQRLMNPGRPVSPFIADYTGISNNMLSDAPSCEDAMNEFADFIGGSNLLAHNASFDKRFLDAEFAAISRGYEGRFICSLLLSRRLYQAAPNHQLATLVDYANIDSGGGYHRALYDSEMTAKLWLVLLADINERYQISDISFDLVYKLQKVPKKGVDNFLRNWS
ncbi:MAG: DNA polymerase-3 subunit epsilon [Pseudohongiellaceae bacterium]|jgi:DNA polymerase-3 subunit epsilon